MRNRTQDNAFLSLSTPLGPDVLVVESLSGSEGLSQPFHFELSVVSANNEISFEKIIGQRVSLTLDIVDGHKVQRHINGFVARFRQERSDRTSAHYTVTIVPWLWFLSRSANCRIFQEKTPPEIIKQVFTDHGMSDFADKLVGDFPQLTYCVQYRERDIDFVSRLMEEFGITYFFEHTEERHTLVLANAKSAHEAVPFQSRVRYKEDVHTGTLADAAGLVTSLHLEQEVNPGKYAHTDYNFEQPQADLMSVTPTSLKAGGNDAFEVYDYPGRFRELDRGEAMSRLRMEEHEATKCIASGSSTCRTFMAGYCFDLVEHPREDINGNYLLVQVWHNAQVGESSSAGKLAYTNTFTMIRSAVPFRPAQNTPKPVMRGPQTAVVVGPSGEEIYTDKHGRVKVHFHWDRKGKRDENSSCWVRVSQQWAGAGYGGICIPRIGQEVIISCLEGDPDQPIIVGRVYNADQMPPFTLPGKKNLSGIKSNSTPGGGGANELHLDDTKGTELFYLHAQKDYTTDVEHDMATTVHVNQTNTVYGQQTETITGNQTLTVKSGAQTVAIKSAGASLTAKTNRAVVVSNGPYSVQAQSDVSLKSDKATLNGIAHGNVTMRSDGADIFVLAPTGRAVVESPVIEIKGTTNIVLTVGGSSIELTASEIKLKSPKISSEAQGEHTIKGGMVKIN